MAKIKQSPKLPAEERRHQLLMAAQKLFARKGYRDTTTNEIARAAKLTKGALYFHFKNKEEILYELIKHVFEHFKQTIDENHKKLVSPAAFLKMFFEPCKVGCGHEDLVNNLDFWVQSISVPKIKRFINEKFEEIINIFVNSIDSGYGRGKKELKQLGVLTYSLIDGLYIRQLLDPSIVNMSTQLKLFEEMTEARAAMIKREKAKK